MKGYTVVIITILGSTGSAFPNFYDLLKTRSILRRQTSASESNCGPDVCPTFDATNQYVSTTGAHAFESPSPSDIRGPCPALNAAANHGYISRNGITTLAEVSSGMSNAFGMDPSLSQALAAYAIAFDGDVSTQTFTIGGPLPSSQESGVTSQPLGLSYSHNNFEGDGSVSRSDAYSNHGDAHSLNLGKYTQAYQTGFAQNSYTLDGFRQLMETVQGQSVANNPEYFAPLFSTTFFTPATYNFAINMFSNHSAAQPSGFLDTEVLNSFFSVAGTYPNLSWKPGQETIPDNLYKRPVQYTSEDFFTDLSIGFNAYPSTFRWGGNTGSRNSYTAIDVETATQGIYTSSSVYEQGNLECFFDTFQQQTLPAQLQGGPNDVAAAIALINQYPLSSASSCPSFSAPSNLYNPYPGRNYHPIGTDQSYKV